MICYVAEISYRVPHEHELVSNKQAAESQITLRYVYQRHSGDGDPSVIPCIRTTLDRKGVKLGVGIRGRVYVCQYGGAGRPSEVGPGTSNTTELKERTPPYVVVSL